jgi:hypothetical protein
MHCKDKMKRNAVLRSVAGSIVLLFVSCAYHEPAWADGRQYGTRFVERPGHLLIYDRDGYVGSVSWQNH